MEEEIIETPEPTPSEDLNKLKNNEKQIQDLETQIAKLRSKQIRIFGQR